MERERECGGERKKKEMDTEKVRKRRSGRTCYIDKPEETDIDGEKLK